MRLGACTTLADLLEHFLIKTKFPVLTKTLQTLGSPLIRRMGTIGGNIGNAAPAGDTLPSLYVLQAEVELRASASVRILPVAEFICGPEKSFPPSFCLNLLISTSSILKKWACVKRLLAAS